MKNIENKYTKKEIVSKLCQAAKLYEKNLLNKTIMFVFETKNSLSHVETIFNDYNFQHLTGINYTGTPKKFLKDCINGVLSLNDISITKDRIAFMNLKLEVLTSAMSINKVAKRIGDYNTKSPSKIVAILSKNRTEKHYNEITYFANNTNLSNLFNINEISKKIDYEKIYSNNQAYQKKINQFFNEIAELRKYDKN